jgi:hypothetical protein
MVIDTATEFAAGIVDDLNAAARWLPLLRDLREISQDGHRDRRQVPASCDLSC